MDGEIHADLIYQNSSVFAIHDNQPQAPVHCLIITKEPFCSFEQIPESLFIDIQKAIVEVASIMKIRDTGYRVVTNIGKDGGQSIPHLHFHVLGGKRLSSRIG
jgi:histidine triad (HIT) family protein